MKNNEKSLQYQLRQLRLVTSWEFMQFFKWKQELVSKLIMLSIAAMVFVWQNVKDDNEPSYQIAITASNAEYALPNKLAQFEFVSSSESIQKLTSQLKEESAFDAVLVQEIAEDGQRKLSIYSQEKLPWLTTLQQSLSKHYSIAFAEKLGLEKQQLEVLSTPATFTLNFMDESIKEDDGISSASAIGMIILLTMGIFTAFGQLFAGVTGEKQQRVTEQLYSCVSAQTWIDGKICGQILHGLKAMLTGALTGLISFSFFSVVINNQTPSFAFINWSLIPWLFLFALAGLYLWTAFMAAIAAAIDDPNHSAKTSLMLLPLVPIVLTFLSMDSPSGWALSFLSYFPLTAFAAMPVKMSLVEVPIWQPLLSLSFMFLLCLWVRAAAGRLFKMGMIMYGKEPTLKDMLRWTIRSD